MCSFLTIKKLLTQWNLLHTQKASNSGCKIPLKQDADVKSNRVIQDREGQMHWVSHLKSGQPTVVKMSKYSGFARTEMLGEHLREMSKNDWQLWVDEITSEWKVNSSHLSQKKMTLRVSIFDYRVYKWGFAPLDQRLVNELWQGDQQKSRWRKLTFSSNKKNICYWRWFQA